MNDQLPAFPYTKDGLDFPGMSLRDYFAAKATEEDIRLFIPETVGDCAKLFHELGYGPKHQDQEATRYLIEYDVHQTLHYWAKYQHADAMLSMRSGPTK